MSGFWKVFGAAALLVAVAVAAVPLVLLPHLDEQRTEHQTLELTIEAELLASVARPVLELSDPAAAGAEARRAVAELSARLHDRRFTVLAADGTVLADSHEDPAHMENHADRPEIVAAREGRPLQPHPRFSQTLKMNMLYGATAVRAEGPDAKLLGFARVALPAADLDAQAAVVRRAVLQGAVIALVVGALLAALLARSVQRPVALIAGFVGAIARGERPARLPRAGHGQLGSLAAAVDDMADQLEQRFERIQRDAAEIRAILASMVEGVLATDADQRVLLMNAAAAEILGTRPEAAQRRRVWEVSRLPELGDLLQRCTRSGRPESLEIARPGDLNDRALRLTAAPLTDAGGLWGCVVVLHDLSEMRRLERVRRDFVVNVSHELKTPLTAMRGFLETVLADETMTEATRQRFLQRARDNTDRLVAIVTDLLTLARVEAEDGRLERAALDLREIVSECHEQAAGLAATRAVTLTWGAPDQPVPVEGDRAALYTALMNLLDNAIKYGPRGGEVRLRVWADAAAGQAAVSVEDQGPGIPPHETERIFERFYRVDKDRSRALGGTGLGLSIVRNVALAHGGRVDVTSALGRGATFTLRLPLAGASAAPPSVPTAREARR
jgi:two-component system phosphate regulon sensor histidine kinase PhoR